MFKRTRTRAAEALESYDEDVETREAEAAKGGKSKVDILGILKSQREQSIGFDNDKEINEERADALDYYKGKHEGAIARDLPVPKGRSTVVSTDVANAVEAALPDIVGVFVGGDDVITFKPQGLEDVQAARQETDYVRHIIFQQNRGFWIFYTGIKDALISKTGIFHFYWDGEPEYEEYQTTATEPQIEEIIEQGNELVSVEPADTVTANGFKQFHVTFRNQISDGHVAIRNVAPEDFTVSPQTIILAESDYCAMKARETRQCLIDKGYDRASVMKLDMSDDVETERDARDTVDENTDPTGSEGSKMLELVDIIVHYIRINLEEEEGGTGKPQIWRIVTGNNEAIELEREKRSRIEFSAITPYPMTHRFYGQSLADKTVQTQKWKTSVARTGNDHLYFANNQRQEVKRAGIIPDITINQLVDNTPGQPVVTEDGQSLRPIQNGSLGIDVLALLGYITADNEERTGIARNTMGLPSDAMHETKGGNDKLISLSQKRHRMMARLFAETGIRDLFIGVHDIARSNATMKDTIELRGEWVDIAPSSWRRRKDAVIDIGIGSDGHEQDLAGLREFRGLISEIVQAQGGFDEKDGLVDKQTIYDFAQNYGRKLKLKAAPQFLKDPSTFPPPDPNAVPPPSPDEIKAAADIKVETFRAELRSTEAQQKAAFDAQMLQAKTAAEQADKDRAHQLAIVKLNQDAALAREKVAAEMTLARERLQMEGTLNDYKEQMAAQKLALENEWTKVEMAAAEARRQTEQRQHELAARETQIREANDQAKIAADARQAELDAQNAERAHQLELEKLKLEARKLDIQERELAITASMPKEAPAQSDNSGNNATAAAMMAIADAMTRKKSVVYKPDGTVEGIE